MTKRSLDTKKSSRRKKNKKSHKNGSISAVKPNVTTIKPDAAKIEVAKATECKERLEKNIHRWMLETQDAPRITHGPMPTIAPLPTILHLMMPSASPILSNNNNNNSLDASMFTSSINGIRENSTVVGTGVVYDDVMLQHESTDPTDYERPGRLKRTLDHLRAIGLLSCCQRIPRRIARTKELRLVHSIDHIDNVDQLEFVASLRKPGDNCSVGQDLYANNSTSKAARAAAGCVVAAALSVVRDEVRNAFALVRPPGHHANANAASGFCFFNNVAVGVRVAQQELQQRGIAAPRVLVLDWDVHHCDGTESIFYEDPSVVVVSIHQYGSGRGHVLRKPPSVFTDTIDVDALAELMEATTVEEINSNNGGSGERNNNNNNNDTRSRNSNDNEKSQESGFKKEGTGGRRRKPVDYAKLAANMEEDDEAIAMMFGITPEELHKSSSDSTITNSSSSSYPSSTGSIGVKRLPGDTDGFSFDEEVNHDSNEVFYPGTGHMERVGGDFSAAARGANINIPWPTAGMGDLEYLQVLLDIVAPVIQEFSPHLVFVSCGFDSAAGDLLGSMRLSPSGYYLLTRALAALCPRLVVALEGGYHLSNVARCSEAVMRALLESGGNTQLPTSRMLWSQTEEVVRQVRRTHEGYWQCFSQSN